MVSDIEFPHRRETVTPSRLAQKTERGEEKVAVLSRKASLVTGHADRAAPGAGRGGRARRPGPGRTVRARKTAKLSVASVCVEQ